ncbi:MAG: site-specific integrase [Candidatus Coatesbacteria bacterium]|nr:site-specific integrase [Candidatus Coatesbacteria bacterium]
MKQAKFKALLFPKPYSNGLYPIYIRIYQNRKSNYISMGHSIPQGAWNPDKNEVWESKPSLTEKLKQSLSKEEIKAFRQKQASIILITNAIKINSDIRVKIAELESLQNKLSVNQEAITSGILKNKADRKDIAEKSRKDFLLYIEEVAKRKYEKKQIRTSEKYSALLRKLKAFRKDKPLPLEELTTSFLNDYQLYLQKEGSHQNYINVNLSVLRTIIQKDAIKEDKILSPEKNPFIWFTMPKILPTHKEKLDINELQKIEGLQLEKNQSLYHVRNAFIFSLYNAGIRIGDLLQLKWCNIKEDGRLEYYMGKTGSERSIKLLPQSMKILKLYESDKEKDADYIFPFLDNKAPYSKLISPEDFQKASPELLVLLYNKIESQATMYNLALKTIAKEAKIKKKISSHIARHSFADIARKKVSVYDIQKMLGHTSMKTTEAYLKSLDNDAMDKAMEEVFK